MRHPLCLVLALFVSVGAVLAAPAGSAVAQQTGYVSSQQGTLPDGVRDIDSFWQRTFKSSGFVYHSPSGVYEYHGTTLTGGCGPANDDNAAFYCLADEAIYLSPTGMQRWGLITGDFSYVAVLAHEWGHHVQQLVGIAKNGSNDKAVELQADCLAGAYSKDANARSLLSPGDLTEAVDTAINAADAVPNSSVDPHGINDERITAFMQGYIDGLGPCSLPFVAGSPTVVQQAQPASPPQAPATYRTAASYLPGGPAVANGGCFTIDAQGAYSAPDIDAFLAGAGAGPNGALGFGWQDGAYINFYCASPPPGTAGFLEVVIHRFSSPDLARQVAPYWQAGHTPAWNETYLCTSQGPLVICADGTSDAGPPTGEVQTLLQQVLASAT